MILAALALYGVKELPGAQDSEIILAWARDLGMEEYNHDAIPWCGLFMAWVAHEAGKSLPRSPLLARNWVNFGVEQRFPMLGDILVFVRTGGGHVGLYVGEDPHSYHVLGGNQGDTVSIVRIPRIRLLEARRPIYKNQPANVRIIRLAPAGALSSNEA